MSLKEKIIEAAQRQRGRTVAVTAWGIAATIRVMSGTERDQWEAELYKSGKMDKEKFRARLLVRTIADEAGQRVFTEADLATLSDMDSVELDRLYTIASKTNGLSKEDVDALTKNSSSGQGEDSTSALPAPSKQPA